LFCHPVPEPGPGPPERGAPKYPRHSYRLQKPYQGYIG